MTCDRCAGCLVREYIYPRGHWWWKCMNCGERLDGLILRQRAEQAMALAMQREAEERDVKEWALWFARMPAVQATAE